jgi:hypothetical protein
MSVTFACKSKDNTKVVVAVWSDLVVPGQMDSISIKVDGPGGQSDRSFSLPTAAALPVQLELVPLAAKDATFTVTAAGMKGTTERVRQSARASFVNGKALLLKMFLGVDCEGKTCSGDTTCAAGECNKPLAVTDLPPYEPDKLVGPDARSADGAVPGIDAMSGADIVARIDTSTIEAIPPDLRAVDTVSADGEEPDVPISTGGIDGGGGIGGSVGSGGISGVGGSGASGGVGGGLLLDGSPIDVGAGGSGGGGASGGGGTSAGGASGSTGIPTCTFGTSTFGNCKFGP